MTTQDVLRLPSLDGLRVAVTAGAAGIGRAIAATLAANGARLTICDMDADADALGTVRGAFGA